MQAVTAEVNTPAAVKRRRASRQEVDHLVFWAVKWRGKTTGEKLGGRLTLMPMKRRHDAIDERLHDRGGRRSFFGA